MSGDVEALAEVLRLHSHWRSTAGWKGSPDSRNWRNIQPACVCEEPIGYDETASKHRAHVAERLAAYVAAERDRAKAESLEEYASELDWVQPETSPCDNPESCCGSEASCDAMQPSVSVVGAASLRARAAALRAEADQ